ncbi:hypothetical protein MYSTI_00673 [Myxococcus stipitatus DSM 14675]|uniref:Uncharacterized protein n=1 Tax=Myxococcus stipitatus (strain DSM 14675 / JCM 12634 / Mx s8) TaxID=1278073 RepID=L7U1F8_MYXSD|nr:DUF99 family protein [Myxococcus stipitatus]AGC42023.1 hypothetical protein MYSTI_00673 [Myxococcus stipitatus DSM 14675]
MRRLPRFPRVIGFDDGPFARRPGSAVPLAGVVCGGTRFEGLVWGRVRRDGWNATNEVCRLLEGGKFLPQVHLVLLDGIAFGGFNVVDLPELAGRLGKPCVAVMRRHPDLAAVEQALRRLPRAEERWARIQRAGAIHQLGGFTFQVQGAEPSLVAEALARVTDRGRVPEALRLAHLIGSAVITGESSQRA